MNLFPELIIENTNEYLEGVTNENIGGAGICAEALGWHANGKEGFVAEYYMTSISKSLNGKLYFDDIDMSGVLKETKRERFSELLNRFEKTGEIVLNVVGERESQIGITDLTDESGNTIGELFNAYLNAKEIAFGGMEV
ncbi:MAG: hypothetical protein N4A47_00375 [Clostridia bacterium]|jgi:hypothetical protein|nr:hypothetical protein [Clostridia bacterium]